MVLEAIVIEVIVPPLTPIKTPAAPVRISNVIFEFIVYSPLIVSQASYLGAAGSFKQANGANRVGMRPDCPAPEANYYFINHLEVPRDGRTFTK
jgi:hypothetical protein